MPFRFNSPSQVNRHLYRWLWCHLKSLWANDYQQLFEVLLYTNSYWKPYEVSAAKRWGVTFGDDKGNPIPGWEDRAGQVSLCQCPSVLQCHLERHTQAGVARHKPLAYRFPLASVPEEKICLSFHTDREVKEGCPTGNESSERIIGGRLPKWNTIEHSQYRENSFLLKSFCLSLPYWRIQRSSIYRVKFRSRIPLPFLQPTKELQAAK